MGFGDFLKAGASALGVDSDDIGGFFDTAKSVVGGDGDASDLFGAAAKQFGIDTDDVTSAVGQVFGGDSGDVASTVGTFFGGDGGGDAVSSTIGSIFGGGGGEGGGFGGAISSFLGEDAGGAAQEAFGSFGSLFGGSGGDIAQSVSDFLPTSVTEAFSEAADLPFVQDAASGNWAELASSVPGLDGALGSFGISTKDVAEHVEGVAGQAIDGGSAWSFGNMLADQGTAFLTKVAAPMEADDIWSSLPGFAQKAGVELPSWAGDMTPEGLMDRGGQFLENGGFVPAQIRDATDLFANYEDVADVPTDMITNLTGDVADRAAVLTAQAPDKAMDEATGESQVPAADDGDMDAFDQQGAPAQQADEFVAQDEFATMETAPAEEMVAAPTEVVQPVMEEAPAPPPDQFAASDALQTGLEDLGDDAFA